MRNFIRRLGSGRKACSRHKTHLQVEFLDDRTVPSTISVLNLADSGAGSLRQAILDANSPKYPNADIINFASGLSGTINLASALPNLSTNIDIKGPGAKLLTVRRDTGEGYRVFTVAQGAIVGISGLTVSNGQDSGIFNAGTLTLNYLTVSGNTSWEGAGIRNSGALTLTNSTVSGNDAPVVMGPTFGGGIYNEGTATVTNSTVSANNATQGAGIFNFGTITLTNCTISGNHKGLGAGSGSGGGIGAAKGGTVNLYNTIVSGNLRYDSSMGWIPGDIGGTVSSTSAYNLIGTGGSGGLTNGTNGNQVGVANPGIGTLADNGGPTQTIALLTGSPARDRGSNALVPIDPTTSKPWATDQRGPGFPRIVNGTVDIGAYEYSPLSR